MTGKQANSISSSNGPHANSVIGASCEDVRRIRMEADAIDVLIMACEDALLANPISHPETSSLIMTTRNEIVPKGSPSNIPHRLVMALVDHNALPKIKGPQADCFVSRRRKQPTSVSWRVIGALRTSDRGSK